MAYNNDIGQQGEDIAARYLSEKGYVLRHKNWRSIHREIDIVAERLGEIVFVEVKTRSIASNEISSALSAVDKYKQRLLILAAHHYMNYFFSQQGRPYRFDIITIVGNSLTHYKRAFSEETFKGEPMLWMEQEW